MLWGVFFRLAFVYHVTWFVNSATHKWGYRNFESSDASRNTWWVALLTWGEGWHNNHHRFPNVCPAGYRWWEFDITYIVIKTLSFIGLAKNINSFPKPNSRGSKEQLDTTKHQNSTIQDLTFEKV